MEKLGSQKLIFRDSRCTDEKTTAKTVGQATLSLPSLAREASPKGESGKTAEQKITKMQDNHEGGGCRLVRHRNNSASRK